MPAMRIRLLSWLRGYGSAPQSSVQRPPWLEDLTASARPGVFHCYVPPEWLSYMAVQRPYVKDGQIDLDVPFRQEEFNAVNLIFVCLYYPCLTRRDVRLLFEEIFEKDTNFWQVLTLFIYSRGVDLSQEVRIGLSSFLYAEVLNHPSPDARAAFCAGLIMGIVRPDFRFTRLVNSAVRAAMKRSPGPGLTDDTEDGIHARQAQVDSLASFLLAPSLTRSQVSRIAEALALLRKRSPRSGSVAFRAKAMFQLANLDLGFHPGYEERLQEQVSWESVPQMHYAHAAYALASRPDIGLSPSNARHFLSAVRGMLAQSGFNDGRTSAALHDFFAVWASHTPSDRIRDMFALWDISISGRAGTSEVLQMPRDSMGILVSTLSDSQVSNMPMPSLVGLVASSSEDTRRSGHTLLARRHALGAAAKVLGTGPGTSLVPVSSS